MYVSRENNTIRGQAGIKVWAGVMVACSTCATAVVHILPQYMYDIQYMYYIPYTYCCSTSVYELVMVPSCVCVLCLFVLGLMQLCDTP